MKKSILFFLMIFIITFTGCSLKREVNVIEKKEDKVYDEKEKKAEKVKVAVRKENENLLYRDEEAFIKYVKEQLDVPDKNSIVYEKGTAYNWDAVEGSPKLISITFIENGEFVAGADCSVKSGEIMRSIVNYMEPEKKKPSAKEDYFKYKNALYGFTIDVPSFLTEKETYYNEGSVRFYNEEGDVSLCCYGDFWPESQLSDVTLDNLYNLTLSETGYEPNYTAKKENWFVISGDYNDVVEYSRYYLKSDGSQSVFTITYPKSREKEFDPIVTHIFKSFKTGKGTVSTVEK